MKPFRVVNLHSDFVQFPPISALLEDAKNAVPKPLFVRLGGDVLDLHDSQLVVTALQLVYNRAMTRNMKPHFSSAAKSQSSSYVWNSMLYNAMLHNCVVSAKM